MKLDVNTNYVILSNSIDNKLLSKFSEYTIVDDDISYKDLIEKLENYLNKVIVYNDCFRLFKNSEKKKIIDLMKLRNINFIIITSNIEDTLFGDYIYVFDQHEIAMEGQRNVILKEEKLLKRLGFGLPFSVDLSTQLIHYSILDKVYYDLESLVNDLWN